MNCSAWCPRTTTSPPTPGPNGCGACSRASGRRRKLRRHRGARATRRRQTIEGAGGHVSQRRQIQRRPASRSGRFFARPARMLSAATSPSTACSSIRSRASYRLRQRPGRFAKPCAARHRRSASAFRGRQAALLRAVRMATRFELTIEPATVAAIRSQAAANPRRQRRTHRGGTAAASRPSPPQPRHRICCSTWA